MKTSFPFFLSSSLLQFQLQLITTIPFPLSVHFSHDVVDEETNTQFLLKGEYSLKAMIPAIKTDETAI
jgi:hypothetical protein